MAFRDGIHLRDLTDHGNVVYSDGGVAIMDYLSRRMLSGSVRFDMILVLQCIGGSLEADLNGCRLSVTEGDILVCTPGVTLDSISVTPDFSPMAFASSYERYQESVLSNAATWKLLHYAVVHPVFHMSGNEYEILRDLAETSRKVMRTNDSCYRREVMDSLIDAVFKEVYSIVYRDKINGGNFYR